MLNPGVLLILIVMGAGYVVGEKVVDGIKKVDHAVAHGAKAAGKKIARVFHHPKPKDEQ